MNSLLRKVTSVGNKRDALIRESLQKQLNEIIIEMQGLRPEQEEKEKEEEGERGKEDQQQQQQQYGKNDLVGNCEEANTLCSILEALFLHGLKDSLLNQVTEALSGPDLHAMPQPSFWGPLLVFSHRQIIDQIQNLTQITTEVGYCRAWIRLALNDGLLSSYFSSIRRDNSVLKPYYNRAAFVRDPDLVDVAQRLLESIDYIRFDLACNTSLLNIWSSTPLLMAAIWSPSLKFCPVSSAVDVAKTINSELTPDNNFDEVETASSIGSLGSLNSSHSALNNITSLNEDDALKIILAKGKRAKDREKEKERDYNGSRYNSFESTSGKNEERRNEEGKEVSGIETAPADKSTDKICNGKRIGLMIETERTEEFPAEEASGVKNEAANDPANTTVGNSLIGRLGWSTSFEDCESSINSGTSGTEAPRTPADARTYDALIQSYHTTGYAATPDLKEFLDGSPSTDSTQNDSGTEPKLPSEIKEAASRSLDNQLGKISREKGLDVQNYSCMNCGHPIGMTFAKAHVCSYSGEYYCSNCMAEEDHLIPSRVIHNWDLKRYPVCQRVARYLNDCPVLLDLKILNPRIYMAVDDMAQLQSLRIQLNLLRAYLFTCREPIIESLQKLVAPRDYLYEHVHQYSVSDLPDIPNGIMAQQLQKIVEFARNHVTNCWLCSQKGFICEICTNPKVIYPFDMGSTYRCAACSAVFHIVCMNASNPCPKCERRRKRMDLPLLDLGNTEIPIAPETPAPLASS